MLIQQPQNKQRRYMFPKRLPLDPQFFDRRKVLEETSNLLLGSEPRSTDIPKVIALFGEPAVGKTQLAYKLMDQHEKDFDCLFMMSADTGPKLSQSFLDVGCELELASKEMNDMAAVRLDVLQWFETTGE